VIEFLDIGKLYHFFTLCILSFGYFFVVYLFEQVETSQAVDRKLQRRFLYTLSGIWLLYACRFIFQILDIAMYQVAFQYVLWAGYLLASYFALQIGLKAFIKSTLIRKVTDFVSLLPIISLFALSIFEPFEYLGSSYWNILFSASQILQVANWFFVLLPLLISTILVIGITGFQGSRDPKSSLNITTILFLLTCFTSLLGLSALLFGQVHGWLAPALELVVATPLLVYINYLVIPQTDGVDPILQLQHNRIKDGHFSIPLNIKVIGMILMIVFVPSLLLVLLWHGSLQDFLRLPGTRESLIGQQLYLYVGGLTIASLILLVLFVQRMMRNISFLIHGSLELARGNFEYKLPHVSGHDEITLLSILFNRLGEYLRGYHTKVIKYKADLEKQVLVRTREWEDKVKQADALREAKLQDLERLQQKSTIIFNNMGEGIALMDATGSIVMVNTLAQNLLDGLAEGGNLKLYLESLDASFVQRFDECLESEMGCKLFVHKGTPEELVLRMSHMVIREQPHVLLVVQKPEKPWGLVRNAATGEPIPLVSVRLFDAKTGKLLDTEVTNPRGNFGFVVIPGQYYVSVLKDGYHFPSKSRKGYRGEVIKVQDVDDGVLDVIIEMDALEQEPEVPENQAAPIKKSTAQTIASGALETVEELLKKQNTNKK
jgi:PAS domain-containing protein